MREDELLYFSEEEFALMMELCEGNEYSLFLAEPEINEIRLREAFLTLFRRGLITRTENSFIPSEEGIFFSELRNAPYVVLLRKKEPEERTVLCYIQKKILWVSELQAGSLSDRYRLRRISRDKISQWMLDTALLPRPVLNMEDTKELYSIYADELNEAPVNEELLRISKYDGSGILLREYALYAGKAGTLIQITDDKNKPLSFYTWDLLWEMLRECFGG